MRSNREYEVPTVRTKYTVQFADRNGSARGDDIQPKVKHGKIAVKRVVQDISKILEDLAGHLHLIEKRNDSFSDVIPILEKSLKDAQEKNDNIQKKLESSSSSLNSYTEKHNNVTIKTGRNSANRKFKVNGSKACGNFRQRNSICRQGDKRMGELVPLNSRKPLYLDPLGSIRKEVERAKAEKKTFTIRGVYFQAVRKALLKRGWIEKIHFFPQRDEINSEFRTFRHYSIPQLVSLMRIHDDSDICNRLIKSKLLASHQVDLYWGSNNDVFKECPDNIKLTKINMFKKELSSFITRECVYNVFKNAFWFQIPCTSNTLIIHHPRTYNLNQNVDTPEFIKDFGITASMSLLKWVVKNSITQECKIVSPSGKVPMTVFDFAVNECYKFIKLAKQEDITTCEEVFEDDWNEFLENFYKILHNENHFKQNSPLSEIEMIRKSNYILCQLKEYWPFLEMDGTMNVWILKSANGKQERRFHIVHRLEYVLNFIQSNPNNKYVIQKYIERPLLIHNTRFDLSLWFLISNSLPLKIWIYEYCYVRFNTIQTRQDIDVQTPNLVQTPCQRNFTDFTCPHENVWNGDQFKNYLSDIGYPIVYNDVILPGMQYCITTAILIQQNNVLRRKNCFKLCRGDFILTEDFQPWLLKINDNPILSNSTPFASKLYPTLLEDVIRVMGDSKSVKVNRNKCCFVPGCTNTSVNNPEKVFMSVPQNVKRKKIWFSAAGREHQNVSMKTHFHCCEDHFKLEEDMENFLEYRLSKVNIRMKPDVVPHIFTCQPDKKISYSRQSSEKRARKRKIYEILQETVMSSSRSFPENIPNDPDPEPSTSEVNKNTILNELKTDFCCQTKPIHYRSKSIQVSFKETGKNMATSPIKFAVPVKN